MLDLAVNYALTREKHAYGNLKIFKIFISLETCGEEDFFLLFSPHENEAGQGDTQGHYAVCHRAQSLDFESDGLLVGQFHNSSCSWVMQLVFHH